MHSSTPSIAQGGIGISIAPRFPRAFYQAAFVLLMTRANLAKTNTGIYYFCPKESGYEQNKNQEFRAGESGLP